MLLVYCGRGYTKVWPPGGEDYLEGSQARQEESIIGFDNLEDIGNRHKSNGENILVHVGMRKHGRKRTERVWTTFQRVKKVVFSKMAERCVCVWMGIIQ